MRHMTRNKSDACRKEIETLLEYVMIEPSKSPWRSGAEMANKKEDKLRFCCDFRYLNSVTVKDAYPIPRIDEILSKIGDAKFFKQFSRVDFLAGTIEETGQGQDGFRMRAGIVSRKKDALWPLQCGSHLPTTDGTSTDKRNKEKRQFGNVLRR